MTDNTIHVDLCVIGAGSGGLSVAAGAAQLGLHVALIEKDKMGGDCLNTGCIPSKALLAAAKNAQARRKSKKYGITPEEPNINFAAVKDHVQSVIAKIEPHDSQERFEGLGVKVFRDAAKLLDTQTVQTGDQKIKARYFVIATGSRASIPPIDGLDPEQVYTNENIFDLREKPDHLIIIGGGPIGIEMAQAHRRLGSAVTVLDIATILPKDDPELVDILRTQLIGEGTNILEEVNVKSVEHTENSVRVHIEKGGDTTYIDGSHTLIAAGRKPNTDNLGLDEAGIKHDQKGITVDQRLRTNHRHIYAIGDVTGGPQFTHAAGYQAGIVIRNIAFKMPAKVNYSALPWVTYSDPELAHCGMTEAQAREKHGDDVHITKWSLSENDRAQSEKNTDGLIKVITKNNGKILGVSILALHAGEMIGTWVLATSKGLRMSDLAGTIMPYPTYGEASKRAAGAFYTPKLFSDRTRMFVNWLQKLPF